MPRTITKTTEVYTADELRKLFPAVIETADANGWEFTEDGEIA